MVDEQSFARSLIAIPSINGAELLKRMLPTLQVSPDLVYVLDQGSEDDTEAVCRNAGVNLVQLGRPHTYTEACNYGARLAKERGCPFVFVGNNDITFTTDVVGELLAELEADPGLAIVAPSQRLIDETRNIDQVAYRVQWDLENLTFAHDFEPHHQNIRRLEADFCELTFAGVRMSVVDEIGFLDDEFGFYHEDADFGLRAREAGYSCAYLPQSQIVHWTSSTVSAKSKSFKENYIKKNKALFSKKHLNNFVRHRFHKSESTDSWNIINKNIHPVLRRLGMVDDGAGELIFSHPGSFPYDILYTVWETTKLPAPWLDFADKYDMVLATSTFCQAVMQDAGFSRTHYVPLGVDCDVFHPWGSVQRFHKGPTFLWFSHNQFRKGLDVMVGAWRPFFAEHPDARLILMGRGLNGLPTKPDRQYLAGSFKVSEHASIGILAYEITSALDEASLAEVYRSVDFLVCSSRAEGFGFSIAEAMACGTPAIFGNFSSMTDFVFDGALTFDGQVARADYTDKGFSDVGDWWEPDQGQLTERLREAASLGPEAYKDLAHTGMRLIRNRFTWRNTAMALRRALITENIGVLSPDEKSRKQASPAIADGPFVLPASPNRPSLAGRLARRGAQLLGYFADGADKDGAWRALRGTFADLVFPYVWSRLSRALKVGKWLKRTKSLTGRPPTRDGVLFIGYAEGALGLGEVFRTTLRAVKSSGLPFGVYPFKRNIETRLIGPYMQDRYDVAHPYPVNVALMAPDQVPYLIEELEPYHFDQSYTVLITYWELQKAPEAWREPLKNVDEIWAPNAFVAGAFEGIFDGPITIVPPAIPIPADDLPDRTHFQLEADRFYFLFSFDYFSSPFRKNPIGVVEAFQRAFPKGDEPVGLVIKSVGLPQQYPDIRQHIQRAADHDPRIRLIDETLSREDMSGLIKSCDAYVSLHRSEGLGLGMIEAMTFGRIVIGTDYSGCSDFLNDRTGFPVPYGFTPIGGHEYPWSEGQKWAQPDVQAAADIMRSVVANPEEARRRGAFARDFIADLYSDTAVANAIKDRLSQIEALRGKADP